MTSSTNCKQLIVDTLKKYPSLLYRRWGTILANIPNDTQELLAEHGFNPKSWKREHKKKILSNQEFAELQKEDNWWTKELAYWQDQEAGDQVLNAEGARVFLKQADTKYERLFVCAPDVFDSELRLVVLEDHKGSIYLWPEDLGD